MPMIHNAAMRVKLGRLRISAKPKPKQWMIGKVFRPSVRGYNLLLKSQKNSAYLQQFKGKLLLH